MIKDVDIAREISELMLDYGGKLDKSVALVREKCTSEEFQEYRRAVGKVMGEILLDVLNPLYQSHPSLKPPEMK